MYKFSCNGSKIYAEYEVVPVKKWFIVANLCLGKGQFKVKVEGEKHIYIIKLNKCTHHWHNVEKYINFDYETRGLST